MAISREFPKLEKLQKSFESYRSSHENRLPSWLFKTAEGDFVVGEKPGFLARRYQWIRLEDVEHSLKEIRNLFEQVTTQSEQEKETLTALRNNVNDFIRQYATAQRKADLLNLTIPSREWPEESRAFEE